MAKRKINTGGKIKAVIDSGNGGTNAILINQDGTGMKQHYEPSVRAVVTGDTLGMGKNEMQYTYIDWNGYRYVSGDDVIRVTRRNIERHMGVARYGNEFHQFLVATSLAKLGVADGEVDLTLFAPPGMYKEARQTIKNSFEGEGKEVEIRLKGDTEIRHWQYSGVRVLPEGIGAAFCFAFDADGNPVSTPATQGNVLIIDIGAYTLDAIQLKDGNFNPESLETATFENEGVDSHIRMQIVHTLRGKSDDLSIITVDDVDRVIRSGAVTGDYRLVIGRSEVDIKPLLLKFGERYAEWIANNVIDSRANGLRGFSGAVVVGGGTGLVMEGLKKWYGDKMLDPLKYSHTKKIHPVDMNAVGGLRFGLAQQQQLKAR